MQRTTNLEGPTALIGFQRTGRKRSRFRGKHIHSSEAIPKLSAITLKAFTSYSRWYVRRHFHSLRVAGNVDSIPGTSPLVVFSNHPSWWDPLVFLILKAELFPARAAFAPIDARMLSKYRFFEKLGFFGVEQNSGFRTGNQFVQRTTAILRTPGTLLALTPQSRFADVRERPVRLSPGIGHLATQVDRARFLPVALEYVFWEERLPEILVQLGRPIVVDKSGPELEASSWQALFENALEETQTQLSVATLSRRPEQFRNVLRGDAGQGGIYDVWRWARATLKGQEFSKEHGTK